MVLNEIKKKQNGGVSRKKIEKFGQIARNRVNVIKSKK